MAAAVRDVAAALLLEAREPPWLSKQHLWATDEQSGRRFAIDADGVFMVLLEHVQEGDRLFYAFKTSHFWQAIDGSGADMGSQYKGPSLTQSATGEQMRLFSFQVSGGFRREIYALLGKATGRCAAYVRQHRALDTKNRTPASSFRVPGSWKAAALVPATPPIRVQQQPPPCSTFAIEPRWRKSYDPPLGWQPSWGVMHEVEMWRLAEQERAKMAEYLVRFLDRAFFQVTTSGALIEVTDTQFAFDPPSPAVKKQLTEYLRSNPYLVVRLPAVLKNTVERKGRLSGPTMGGDYFAGETYESAPHGEGAFVLATAPNQRSRYSGHWIDNNLPVGRLAVEKDDVLLYVYEGQLVGFTPHGTGKCVYFDSEGRAERAFTGNWNAGAPSTTGVWTIRRPKNTRPATAPLATNAAPPLPVAAPSEAAEEAAASTARDLAPPSSNSGITDVRDTEGRSAKTVRRGNVESELCAQPRIASAPAAATKSPALAYDPLPLEPLPFPQP